MWQLIVAELIKTLLPYIQKLLERWLASDLKAAAEQAQATSPNLDVKDSLVEDLFGLVLAKYPVWNPLNWWRRRQIATIRDTMAPYSYRLYAAATAVNAGNVPGDIALSSLSVRALNSIS
jgi:hypothetical protein